MVADILQLPARWIGLAALLVVVSSVSASDSGMTTVRVAVPQSQPPYFIPRYHPGVVAKSEKEAGKQSLQGGMAMEILRAAFALSGYVLEVDYAPSYRVATLLTRGLVDCATGLSTAARDPSAGSIPGTRFSDPVVSHQYYAITLADRGYSILEVDQLHGLSIVAFRDAAAKLGPDFAGTVANNPLYREKARLLIQPLLLYRDRVDAVIADRRVFLYNRNRVADKIDPSRPLSFHLIFQPFYERLACRDSEIITAFNRGLGTLQQDGAYQAIIARYESGIGGG